MPVKPRQNFAHSEVWTSFCFYEKLCGVWKGNKHAQFNSVSKISGDWSKISSKMELSVTIPAVLKKTSHFSKI